MACFERRIIEEHENFARAICDFIYIDGRGRNGFQNHTEEEYQKFLAELARESFDTYTDAAKEMGWID